MTRMTLAVALLAATTLPLAGCPKKAQTETATPAGGAAAAPADLPSQVAAGMKVYADTCATCHGDKGEGSKQGPPVIGASALPLKPPADATVRKIDFHNADEIAQWVKKEMPIDDAGSLSVEQAYAVTAFMLQSSGTDLKAQPLTTKAAAAIVIHP